MRKLDQRGVAAVTVVVIIAVSAGGAVATPVAVDLADVDPDHPLYGLERLGERIRRVGDVDQMKERWAEFQRMEGKAKGWKYRNILAEFRDKMNEIIEKMPENVESKAEIIAWMQDQMPGIGRIRIGMLRRACGYIKEDLADKPEIGKLMDETMDELDNLEQELRAVPPEQAENFGENFRARMWVIRRRIRNIVARHPGRIRRPANVYIDIDDVVGDVNVTINAEVNVVFRDRHISLADRIDAALQRFNEKLTAVQAKLAELPENSHLRTAVEVLVDRAVVLKNRALELRYVRPRRALGLLFAANRLLRNAYRILERIEEYTGESIDAYVEGFPAKIDELRLRVDNLPFAFDRARLDYLLDLAQSAFDDGNYGFAEWCLDQVGGLLATLERGEVPWLRPTMGPH
jgi:thioesterase domain-containing protein